MSRVLYRNPETQIGIEVERGSKKEDNFKRNGWICQSKSIDERKKDFDEITIEDLTKVDGIGNGTAKKLMNADICSVADILAYTVEEIVEKTGLQAGRVENFYEKAKGE
jgi:DNA polymerase/3'-5' exonuclease PolX